ncbi:fidgetin-like protein 1 isoform X2 [Contarinia nasturtii]|nr:fidgetin-like protein 1 isoform X2 [Contarinia nasturtii]
MMKEMNVQIAPGSLQSNLDTKQFDDILKSKKCENTCKNDALLDDLDKFFNLMKKRPTINSQKPPYESKNTKGESSKMCINDSGDLVFNMNFKGKTAFDQNTPNQQPYRPTLNNQFHNQTTQNQTSHQNDISRPAETTNAFHPIYATKRKTDNDIYESSKRPSYLPTTQQEKIEPNLYAPQNSFRTATEELSIQHAKKYGMGNNQNENMQYNVKPSGGLRKSLGGRRSVGGQFVSPLQNSNTSANNSNQMNDTPAIDGFDMNHPRLKNVDSKMIEAIQNEIVTKCDVVDWDSIAGLQYAKKTLQEAVVLPILRPDIFTGIRAPPRGVLLFGPPGTGKTLIGKCIASQSNSTFFSISASSLTSKWIGEGEKMVRALFAVAAASQPSVVFIDEVDSLLCQRSESEHESSRRLKTEFLVQLDGTSTAEKDRVLIVGATNRPQELDEAARRRFVKRLYVPLPDTSARKEMIFKLLSMSPELKHSITEAQIENIAQKTDGFSGSDMTNLCKEACSYPVTSMSFSAVIKISADSVRPVTYNDFLEALNNVRASVSPDDLEQYIQWNGKYGSGNAR